MKTFKSITAAFALLASLSAPSGHASALLKVEGGVIHVISRMVYSGPAATPEIANAATLEIVRMWNAKPTFVDFEGKPHRVVFDVDYVMDNGAPLPNPNSCAYNYIQIKDKIGPRDRSFYSYLGANSGVFYTSDGLGTSTTAAHEYGHGLGLEHNDFDQIDTDVPGIMFARGTFVKQQFQYRPEIEAGKPGGTVNPIFRRVRSVDIREIDFIGASLSFGFSWSTRFGCLGSGTIQRIPAR